VIASQKPSASHNKSQHTVFRKNPSCNTDFRRQTSASQPDGTSIATITIAKNGLTDEQLLERQADLVLIIRHNHRHDEDRALGGFGDVQQSNIPLEPLLSIAVDHVEPPVFGSPEDR
jgi:hypothetical protein